MVVDTSTRKGWHENRGFPHIRHTFGTLMPMPRGWSFQPCRRSWETTSHRQQPISTPTSCPPATYHDMRDSDPIRTFTFAVAALSKLGVAYVLIMEARDADLRHGGKAIPVSVFRPHFNRTLIVNQDYHREKAEVTLARGNADLVSFARLFLANPDLPTRFAKGASLNTPDPATFYGGGEKGYTDYPFWGWRVAGRLKHQLTTT